MNEDQSAPVRGKHARHWLIVKLRREAVPGMSNADPAKPRTVRSVPVYRFPWSR